MAPDRIRDRIRTFREKDRVLPLRSKEVNILTLRDELEYRSREFISRIRGRC